MKMYSQKQKETKELGVAEYECEDCNDEGVLFSHTEETGDGYKYDMYKPCHCIERKAWKRRFESAFIPEEFTRANFENYQRQTETQQAMFEMTKNYLTRFPDKSIGAIGVNNYGLIAVIGEQRIHLMPPEVRAEAKVQHNNFGVGKTHLQIALSKQLIKNGLNVLVISDVSFMDEMMNARMMQDGSETFNKLLQGVMDADVLVWDDIGKARPTEAKEALYYNIINERYKKQRPIVFNSNEDRGTLAERIGYAASSRLIGSCYDAETDTDFLLEVEGEDWRLKKK